MKTESSVKNIIGRAVASYRREHGVELSHRVSFGTDGSVTVNTVAARNDNTAWARKPMDRVASVLDGVGYTRDYSRDTHCCGSVSATFRKH